MNQCCAIDPKKSSPGDAAEIFARLEEERVIAASERFGRPAFSNQFSGSPTCIVRDVLEPSNADCCRCRRLNRCAANLTTRRVAVCWTKGSKHGTEILNFLNRLGFDASLDDLKQTLVDQDAAKGRRLLSSMAVSGFAAANIMLLSISCVVRSGTANCATFSSHFRDHCSPCRGLCRAAVFSSQRFLHSLHDA